MENNYVLGKSKNKLQTLSWLCFSKRGNLRNVNNESRIIISILMPCFCDSLVFLCLDIFQRITIIRFYSKKKFKYSLLFPFWKCHVIVTLDYPKAKADKKPIKNRRTIIPIDFFIFIIWTIMVFDAYIKFIQR